MGVRDSLDPKAGNITIEIAKLDAAKPGVSWLAYLGPGWGTADIDSAVLNLAPGQGRHQTYTVFWNRPLAGDDRHIPADFGFPAPGRYSVRARYIRPTPPDVISSPVVVEVQAPAGADAAVWAALQAAPQLAMMIQRPVSRGSADKVAALQKLVDTYPTAAAAPYIRAAIDRARLQQ